MHRCLERGGFDTRLAAPKAKQLKLPSNGKPLDTEPGSNGKPPNIEPSGKPLGIEPSGGKSPSIEPSGRKPLGIEPSSGKSPGTQPSGGKPPGIEPSGGKSPSIEPSGGKPLGTEPSGGKPPSIEPSGRKSPGAQPSSGKSPSIEPTATKPAAKTRLQKQKQLSAPRLTTPRQVVEWADEVLEQFTEGEAELVAAEGQDGSHWKQNGVLLKGSGDPRSRACATHSFSMFQRALRCVFGRCVACNNWDLCARACVQVAAGLVHPSGGGQVPALQARWHLQGLGLHPPIA